MQTKNEAIESVKNGKKEYYLKLLGFSQEWVKTMFKAFTSEDLKEAFYKANEPPPEPRIFGAVFQQLAKDNLIFPHGFSESKNPICHGRPMRVWISREYREKQQKNATKEQSLKLF